MLQSSWGFLHPLGFCMCCTETIDHSWDAGSCEWADLTPHQRMAVVTTLTRLAGDSSAARTQLAEEDAARKEDRKQLDELRKQARKYALQAWLCFPTSTTFTAYACVHIRMLRLALRLVLAH